MNAARAYARVLWALIRQDVRAELRSLETLTALVTFALLVLLVFGLALNPVERELDPLVPGLYWVALAFAAVIALGRSFTREREAGMLEALAMLPVDRSVVYVAKAAVSGLWLWLVALAMAPLFFVFLEVQRRPPLGGWLLVTLAGIGGLVAVGTLLAGMAVHIRGADVLLPLLLLPLSLPVLIAAVRVSEALLDGQGWAAAGPWFRLLVGYDIVFFVVSLVLFDYLVEV
ncbi:MAG TPA: heme exporter protein CcmB [Bacillota bacterium]